MSALNAWDDERNINLFRHDYYKLGESKIIILEETDVGWMQVHHGATDIALHQLHLIKPYRGRKLGTQIIDDLLERARQQKKTVSLSVIKNNPAINLYQRLGFSVVGSDDTKIHMNS
ncbi:MAG: GNAT family N-acetyltransferase [Geminicoccales bacterium]